MFLVSMNDKLQLLGSGDLQGLSVVRREVPT